MTGSDKLDAAFSHDGTPEFPVVICYEGIFLRDHWEEVTDEPWWANVDTDPTRAMRPIVDMVRAIDMDWFRLPLGHCREERDEVVIQVTDEGVFRLDKRTGKRDSLERPPVGGMAIRASTEVWSPPAKGVQDIDELDALLEYGPRTESDPEGADALGDAHLDLPRMLRETLGAEKAPYMCVCSPFWRCHGLWGFEGLMRGVHDFPHLIEHACERLLEQELGHVRLCAGAGARFIWIEECMTDMISPEHFRRLVLPNLRALVDAIRDAGMYSVYYYCGNPHTRWDMLMESRSDALALEEGKKGFAIDVDEVADRLAGHMTLFGNLDAVGVLEKASEDALRREIDRQLAAGRKNRRRFVMSIGSPVTPSTPASRVHRYGELVRELGAR